MEVIMDGCREGEKLDWIKQRYAVNRPFGRLGRSPWRSVGCGPAAGVCRPLRKTRGLQSARCFLRRVETEAGCNISGGQTRR